MWSTLLPLLCAGQAFASLSGSVGPTTSFTSKAENKVCNIVDYGASTNSDDISTALSKAWSDCAVGGLVYIPPGDWSLSSFPTLKHGNSSAVQLDGVIHRTGSDGSNMLLFRDCKDLEFFSGNSEGAIQGYGYKYLADGKYGPRLVRFQDVEDFSIHGIALIDSPAFYLVLDTVTNGEVYNLIASGATILGGTDGIDVWGDNVWVHDVEVTNGDECVTVKSPASNILVESIYCNLSGGNAIGSLSTNTSVSDITYRHIYANGADACFIKSHGGTGTVQNILWDTVIVRDAPYPVLIDSNWSSQDDAGGDGVFHTNLTFRNWYGYDIKKFRPVIKLDCPEKVPCTDITFDDVNLWAADGEATEECWNAYGTGACLKSDDGSTSTYTSDVTLTTTPSYTIPTMPNDITAAVSATSSFTIPSIPTSFYPGLKPSSDLLYLTGPAGSPTSSDTQATSTNAESTTTSSS